MNVKKLLLLFLFILGLFMALIFINAANSRFDSILKTNQISVRWPKDFRLGITESIQVLVSQGEEEFSLNGAALDSASLISDPSLEPYYANLEARVELAGLQVDPPGLLSKNIQADQNVKFTWKISADQSGVYAGTIWLYLNLVPKNPTDPKVQEILLAKPIEIQVKSLFGFQVWVIRGVAFVLLAVSAFLLLIDFGLIKKIKK
jgi:hypothetical protein